MAILPYGSAQSYTFRDKRGFSAVTRMFQPSTAGGTQYADAKKIAIALAAVSHSAEVLDEDGATQLIKSNGLYTSPTQSVIAATSGPYDSVADKVAIILVDAAGRPHKYLIACPIEGIFAPDNVQVIKTTTAFAVLVSQMLATAMFGAAFGGVGQPVLTSHPVVSAQGAPLVGYQAGYRVRRETPRRMSTTLLDANDSLNVWP